MGTSSRDASPLTDFLAKVYNYNNKNLELIEKDLELKSMKKIEIDPQRKIRPAQSENNFGILIIHILSVKMKY